MAPEVASSQGRQKGPAVCVRSARSCPSTLLLCPPLRGSELDRRTLLHDDVAALTCAARFQTFSLVSGLEHHHQTSSHRFDLIETDLVVYGHVIMRWGRRQTYPYLPLVEGAGRRHRAPHLSPRGRRYYYVFFATPQNRNRATASPQERVNRFPRSLGRKLLPQ